MGLPKSAMGIVGLFIIVAWLVGLLLGSVDPRQQAINTANDQMLKNIGSAVNTNSTDTGLPLIGDSLATISSVFAVIFNLIGLTFGFLASMVITFLIFIESITMIPPLISGIFIALISIGFIFALLSKVIER